MGSGDLPDIARLAQGNTKGRHPLKIFPATDKGADHFRLRHHGEYRSPDGPRSALLETPVLRYRS